MPVLFITSHNDLNTAIGWALLVALIVYIVVTLVAFIRGL